MIELADSIKKDGVLQPILVRHHPREKYIYQLIFGHRRRLACEMAGLETILAYIKEIADEDILEIQVTENLHRKDVHPIDEAAAYKAYMDDKKVTIEELSAKFAKRPEYIAQRLSFNALIPDLKKDFSQGILLIGHAVLLARLQPADQKTVMASSRNQHHKDGAWYEAVDDMKDTIESEIMHELGQAGFDKKDAKLVPKAGACLGCQKRSGAGLLFADVKEKDRCFDAGCYKSKVKAHLLRQIDELVISANPMPVVVGYGTRDMDPDVKKKLADNKVKLLVEYNDYSDSPKSSKSSTLALKVCGTNAGKIIGITLKDTEKAKAAKSASAGTSDELTADQIDQQIADIKERTKRGDELDAEKVHARITEQLLGLKPFQDIDCKPSMIKAPEHAAMLYILFQKMDSDDQEKVSKALKVKGDKKYGRYFMVENLAIAKALADATPEIYAFITRCAIKETLIGNIFPPTAEAHLVRQIAETYEGVPISTYEAEQKIIADKRKGNAQKRITDLQKKKADLAPKTSKKSPDKEEKAKKVKGLAKGIKTLLDKKVDDDNDDDE